MVGWDLTKKIKIKIKRRRQNINKVEGVGRLCRIYEWWDGT